ncbi:MAG: hypothetical protein ACOX2N_04625 [Peptococcia bacterium]|jgi:hypothetical protein
MGEIDQECGIKDHPTRSNLMRDLRRYQVGIWVMQKKTLKEQKKWFAQQNLYVGIPTALGLIKDEKRSALVIEEIPPLPEDIWKAREQLRRTSEQLRESTKRLLDRYEKGLSLIPGFKTLYRLIRGEDFSQVEKLSQLAEEQLQRAEELLPQIEVQQITPERDRKSLKDFVVLEKGAQPQENSLVVEEGAVEKASLQRSNDEPAH